MAGTQVTVHYIPLALVHVITIVVHRLLLETKIEESLLDFRYRMEFTTSIFKDLDFSKIELKIEVKIRYRTGQSLISAPINAGLMEVNSS